MPKEIWISANEAADILSANSGRQIIPQYVRDLAQKSKIAQKKMDGRTNLYLRSDVEKIKVRPHGKNKPVEPTQTELPLTVEITSPSVEEKTVNPIHADTSAQIPIVARFEDMPPGSMKRKEFAAKYGLFDNKLGDYIRDGISGDKLQITYYPYHQSQAVCFSPKQIEYNLEILKRHGKLK